ncbi:MAG: pyridoxamine 5'-phosphate oxidase family protein [Lentimicrobiaceae bacterium]|jgi:general stress protein 26
MKNKCRLIAYGAYTALLLSTTPLAAQENKGLPYQPISYDSLLYTARTIVDSARCQVLITVDEKGQPYAREMSPFSPENDWVIWLGTTRGSRKTNHILHNPNVVVYYYDTKGKSYVSVSGKARLVDTPAKKAKYWKDGWKIFYPDRDKNYILIEVIPEKLEVCSFRYKLFWEPVTGIPHSVDFITKHAD